MNDATSIQGRDSAHAYSFRAMGTICTLQLYADSLAQADMAAAWALAEVERIEAKYSRYSESSTLSSINRAATKGEPVAVDEETAGLFEFAFACHQKSKGLFDITSGILRRAWDFSSGKLPDGSAVSALLPFIGMDKLLWRPPHLIFLQPGMELDFGGIGKEYAVDRLGSLLNSAGIMRGLVDLGGDLVALGPHPDGQPWRIGLRNPDDPTDIAETVALSCGALATSGDYERRIEIDGVRYCHILNPYTGWPVRGLSSVTVVAPQCMEAGSVATIAILKGYEGIPWLACQNLSHCWIDEQGQKGRSCRLPRSDRSFLPSQSVKRLST